MRGYRNLIIVKFEIKINPLNFDFFAKRIIHHIMKKITINAYNTKTNRDVLKFKKHIID